MRRFYGESTTGEMITVSQDSSTEHCREGSIQESLIREFLIQGPMRVCPGRARGSRARRSI